MRYVLFAVATLGAGVGFAVIAAAVLPQADAMSRRSVIAVGLAAGVVGLLAALGYSLLGPIVATVAAFLFVFLYCRFARAQPAR